jgi:hypothetical protein
MLFYTAISIAIIAYIYTSYPLQPIADIPFTHLTVRELVNIVGFILVIFFGVILGGGLIRAGFSDGGDQDHGYLLVVLTLVFLFQRSEQYMTLAGYALRAIRSVILLLIAGFVGRLS